MLRRRNWANTAETRAYYISFYNSMWLVANDIIIGLAIGSFLTTNRYIMSYLLHKILHEYTVESLQSRMLWFLESPAGLKLNHELGSFLSELFLWLIRLWTAARIFNWQLITLYSLFNLFRGKKRNMLRHRIDACDYDLDQLLLGTCLFTLLTFLFPTVLIYYVTFALGRVGVIFLQAIMETLLAFFNHFPLFAIMLRMKDPDRLPGGLRFDIFEQNCFLKRRHRLRYVLQRLCGSGKRSDDNRPPSIRRSTHRRSRHQRKKSVRFKSPKAKYETAPHRNLKRVIHHSRQGSYLWMWNSPIPFSAIFFQYMLLWKRLSAHYFSAYYFKCFLYGEPIKPIPKLQVR
ncbi:N-acetylglucosaminyl transferase component-domain-containing protein [Zychaea mexicana]|uniref:N-acetylglucosaminyl transferase component-domain-containing protein n=1 Tax=Zychaea mexicana TaxID=64656 RepID=UPI0022FEF33A|nr:N-acetylglucosaminyl transferase component-domain-containing protein [Zychaea mexicana]KAI9479602.1 N-acetylglucosaminyl transferase component-domain-containing protein [Zychaea mexicana]